MVCEVRITTKTQSFTVIIDHVDLIVLASHRWRPHTKGYAFRDTEKGGKRKTIYLHRVIYERAHGPVPWDKVVDHKNTNRLDCRRENLRAITELENKTRRFRKCSTGVEVPIPF